VFPWSPAEGISAPFSPLDLADPSSPQRIAVEIEPRRIHVDLLVNKAGFSPGGEFLSHGPKEGTSFEEAVWATRMGAERSVRIAAMETANVGLDH
jgi:NADP-dependent 3-hydroxy acid dehydrogenase YdfG